MNSKIFEQQWNWKHDIERVQQLLNYETMIEVDEIISTYVHAIRQSISYENKRRHMHVQNIATNITNTNTVVARDCDRDRILSVQIPVQASSSSSAHMHARTNDSNQSISSLQKNLKIGLFRMCSLGNGSKDYDAYSREIERILQLILRRRIHRACKYSYIALQFLFRSQFQITPNQFNDALQQDGQKIGELLDTFDSINSDQVDDDVNRTN
jgi:hypothetical protein